MPHRTRTARTQRPFSACGDRDTKPSWPVTDTFDVNLGQANQQLAHARKVFLHQGLPGSATLDTVRLTGPLYRARDLPQQTKLTPRSEAPDWAEAFATWLMADESLSAVDGAPTPRQLELVTILAQL